MAYEELKTANARRKGMTEAAAAKESMKAPKGDGLVDMKMPKKQAEEMTKPSVQNGPRYPYGLTLRLGEHELKKLGLKGLPEVGDTVTVTAKARVQSAESRHEFDGDEKRECCLQIIKMKVS